MASDYYFGIFQLFLSKYYQLIIFNNLVIFVTATDKKGPDYSTSDFLLRRRKTFT